MSDGMKGVEFGTAIHPLLLVKFPSRSRPTRFLEVLREWVRMADDLPNIHWLFSFDQDDASMAGIGGDIAALGIDATIVRGHSNSKVEAINRDFEHAPPWDIVLVLSDDMHCVKQGWDTEIRKAAAEHPDSLIWFPDQVQRSMCTLPCMDRAYYDRDGWIYDPRFKSVYCDDLSTDIAKQRGRFVTIDVTIAHHLHPANVHNVTPDALYRMNETPAIWKADEALYRSLTPYPRK